MQAQTGGDEPANGDITLLITIAIGAVSCVVVAVLLLCVYCRRAAATAGKDVVVVTKPAAGGRATDLSMTSAACDAVDVESTPAVEDMDSKEFI